jgi:alkylation response protein AidB-like acyl-CoA dehydrogenase
MALGGWGLGLVDDARAVGGDARRALEVAERWGARLPVPGAGQTAARWRALEAVGELDLTAARVLEAHADALAILAEAMAAGQAEPGPTVGTGAAPPPGTWGVFAADSPGSGVTATPAADGQWRLHGRKAWCSLGDQLDRALVTARAGASAGTTAGAGPRRLFAVDLGHPSVSAESPQGWVAGGLREVTSTSLTFAGTPATPVGGDGWYLRRPGFWWGGMGVAACWLGGAAAVAGELAASRPRRHPDLHAMHVGAADVGVHAASVALLHAAGVVDSGGAAGDAGHVLAQRVRALAAEAAERALRHSGHDRGPAPLAFDETHARRVSDLELYIRQHHAESDLAALGAALTSP